LKPSFFLGLEINDRILGDSFNSSDNLFKELKETNIDLLVYNGSEFLKLSNLN